MAKLGYALQAGLFMDRRPPIRLLPAITGRTMILMEWISNRIQAVLKHRAFLALLCAIGFLSIWIWVASNTYWRNLLGLLGVLITRLICLRAAMQPSQPSTFQGQRKVWRFIGAGMALWMIADLFAIFHWVRLGGGSSAPTAGDLFRMAGFGALITSVAFYTVSSEERFGRYRNLLDVAILMIAATGLSWMVFLRPVFELQVSNTAILLWLGIPILGDVLFAVFSLRILLLTMQEQRAALPLLLLGGASLCFLATDLLAGYQALLLPTEVGGYENIGAIFGNLLVAYGIYRSRDPSPGPVISKKAARASGKLEPLLVILGAYFLVMLTGLEGFYRESFDQIGVGAAVGIAVLLIARQGVIMGQSEMQQYAALIRSTSDLAFICDAEGELHFLNQAFRKATGYSREEAAKGNLADFISRKDFTQDLFSKAGQEGWQGEVNLLRKDRSHFPVSLSIQPIATARGGELLFACTAHDLTRIKAREAELREALANIAEAREELEELNVALEVKVQERTQDLEEVIEDLARLNKELKSLDQLKTDFIALVSHELRAPLTNIRTGIELLLERYQDITLGARESLTLVQEETKRLSGLVETVLNISALEAGRLDLACQPLDIVEAVSTARDRFPARTGIERLQVNLPDNLPQISADPQALDSVLFHLIDNALKYDPEGNVYLKANGEETHLRISVTDQGPGIPLEERERIFDMFHRLDTSDARDTYGYGLGLPMVKRLLEAMGGTIQVRESEGGGSCFSFWLPYAE